MIHILFLTGTFGSTVQYLIRTYNAAYQPVDQSQNQALLTNGSMHGYNKTGHYDSYPILESFLEKRFDTDVQISTPTYPMSDAHAKEIIELIQSRRPADPVIFLYVDSMEYAEINFLAQYHKVSDHDPIESIRLIVGEYYLDVTKWNPDYQHWTDMQPWELREWISIFYSNWISESLEAVQYVDASWLALSTREMLNNTESSFNRILEYSGVDNIGKDVAAFGQEWRARQQYLLDEYTMINIIVDHVINNRPYTWPPVHFIAEIIIQKKLRDHGYELKCFDLNVFPNDAKKLYKLLEQI